MNAHTDYRSIVAAEVSARYGLPVSPEAVQIIPRGVSAFEPGEIEELTYRMRHRIAADARVSAYARQQRFAAAAQKPVEPVAAPVATISINEQEALAIKGEIRAVRREGAFVPLAHWFRLLIGQGKTPAECGEALGTSEKGAKQLATKCGVTFPEPPKPPRQPATVPAAAYAATMERNAERHDAAEQRRDNLARWARDGWTMEQLMAATGSSRLMIRKDLNLRGLSLRNGVLSELTAPDQDAIAARNARILQMRRHGIAFHVIAAEVGMSKAATHAIWTKASAK